MTVPVRAFRTPAAMASNAKRTHAKRTRRQRNAGKKRKKDLESSGTTRSEEQLFGNTLDK